MPYSKRRCTGSPTCPAMLTRNERYCPEHTHEQEQRRGSAWSRGYNAAHRALRKQWQDRISRGEPVFCARGCGKQITGTEWDLGHTDDRSTWTGPECRPCNRAHGGRKALAARR